jgi:hypothetical protein
LVSRKQVAPQFTPDGTEVTVPAPVPSFTTLRRWTDRLKVAVTVVAALTVVLQVGTVPVQPPPLQPPNTAPRSGVAVNVTTVPPA